MRRRPLWQYLILDWARWLSAFLIAFAAATATLHRLPNPDLLVAYLVFSPMVYVPFTRHRWQQLQMREPPAPGDTHN